MVFFADDELYRVIQKDIKNDFGQVVATYTKEKIPYMVNIQPIEEKSVKYTFGEDIESTVQAYVENEMNFNIGDVVVFENIAYEVEKKVAWKSYDIIALKRVDIEWQ